MENVNRGAQGGPCKVIKSVYTLKVRKNIKEVFITLGCFGDGHCAKLIRPQRWMAGNYLPQR